MIVLHILLGILKAVGILLLILLGLLLLLLLSLLFCPVGYGIQGEKDEAGCRGTAKISWLFHLVSVKGTYSGSGGEMQCTVRLFGIPLEKVLALLEKRRERRKNSKNAVSFLAEASKEQAQEQPPRTEAKVQETEPKPETTEENKQKKQKHTPPRESWLKKAWNFLKKLWELPSRFFKALKNFRLTWKKICAKMESIKKLLKSEQFQNGKSLLFAEVKKFLRRIRPGKVEGHVKFGLEDPCLAGELLGAAGIFYPLYGKHFTIEPYFDRNLFQGRIGIKGRIYGIHFVLLAWNLFWSRDIRYLVKKIRTYF